MFVIIANFGNDSIALIEWAKQRQLADVKVVSVDTGWAAPRWADRVAQADAYIKQAGFEHVRLKSPLTFDELVQERHNFPSLKFHWCAKFLKGLPILDWLDEVDPAYEAIILTAKRQSQAAALAEMSEFVEESELWGWRKLWQPLCEHDLTQRNALITASGFDLLESRSLECDPCIYSQRRDMAHMEASSKQQLAALESQMGKPMFPVSVVLEDRNLGADERDIYFTGCGSEFGCGE